MDPEKGQRARRVKLESVFTTTVKIYILLIVQIILSMDMAQNGHQWTN